MVRPEPAELSRETQHRGRVCRLRTVRHGWCADGQPRGSRGEAAVGCRIPRHRRAFAVPADRQGPVSLAHGVLKESLRERRVCKPQFLSIVEEWGPLERKKESYHALGHLRREMVA